MVNTWFRGQPAVVHTTCYQCGGQAWHHPRGRCLNSPFSYATNKVGGFIVITDTGIIGRVYLTANGWKELFWIPETSQTYDTVIWCHYLTMKGVLWSPPPS